MRAVIEKEPALVSEAAAKADDSRRYGARHRRAQARAHFAWRSRQHRRQGAEEDTRRSAIQRVAAFADDLRRYLDHEPVSARADSLGYRAGKFVRRYRLAVGAASATLLALLAGVIGTTWQAIEARNQRDEARYQAERALAKGNLVG